MESAKSAEQIVCTTCFRHCGLAPGQTGFCRARWNRDGSIVAKNYGYLTALALDPIEKKPLRLFFPGSSVLSAGSYGCNLRCPFCQNSDISQADSKIGAEYVSPQVLAEKADELRGKGNIGVAYTYNEPLVGWEYVRDTAKIVREYHMKNIIVTNGSVSPEVLERVLPYTDAMNIDLKGFTTSWYKSLGGDLETVKQAIVICAKRCHVELTTLIVPDGNDSETEMEELASWVASVNRDMALHITRFFPRWHIQDKEPTNIELIHRLAEIAGKYLPHVFTGNC
jgi:pyruvate formate lyase activating enzyme